MGVVDADGRRGPCFSSSFPSCLVLAEMGGLVRVERGRTHNSEAENESWEKNPLGSLPSVLQELAQRFSPQHPPPAFPPSTGLSLIQLYISLRDDGALTLSLGS